MTEWVVERLGRKGDGTAFDQTLAGKGGQAGQGMISASGGSRNW